MKNKALAALALLFAVIIYGVKEFAKFVLEIGAYSILMFGMNAALAVGFDTGFLSFVETVSIGAVIFVARQVVLLFAREVK